MDFDLDDPIADLLSDGSNDSIFELPSKKKSQTGKDSRKIADLFNIGKEETSDILDTKPQPIPTTSSSTMETTTRRATPTRQSPLPKSPVKTSDPMELTRPTKKEFKFDDSDDLIKELGFDPKKPKSSMSGAKATSILDDLLDFSRPKVETKPPSPIPRPQTPVAAATPPPKSDQQASRYSPSLGRPRTTTRANSGDSLNDPLGFFTKPNRKIETEATDKSKQLKRTNTVDWLGLDLNKSSDENVHVEKIPVEKSSVEKNVRPEVLVAKPKPEIEKQEVQKPSKIQSVQVTKNVAEKEQADELNQSFQLMNLATIEQETAVQSLQQQQNQLQMVSHIKQQESVLIEMREKQRKLLQQQESQFNELLKRQMNRQQTLEENIQRQQQQINAYVNVLMSQPANAFIASAPSANASDTDTQQPNDRKQSEFAQVELAADVKRLELENLRLEDALQSIRTNHDQEMELVETSYK